MTAQARALDRLLILQAAHVRDQAARPVPVSPPRRQMPAWPTQRSRQQVDAVLDVLTRGALRQMELNHVA